MLVLVLNTSFGSVRVVSTLKISFVFGSVSVLGFSLGFCLVLGFGSAQVLHRRSWIHVDSRSGCFVTSLSKLFTAL